MRPPHHILDSYQVHRAAAEHLQAHLQFQDYKRQTSAPVLWSLLLAAAARITSLSDACGSRKGVRKVSGTVDCEYESTVPDTFPTPDRFVEWDTKGRRGSPMDHTVDARLGSEPNEPGGS